MSCCLSREGLGISRMLIDINLLKDFARGWMGHQGSFSSGLSDGDARGIVWKEDITFEYNYLDNEISAVQMLRVKVKFLDS